MADRARRDVNQVTATLAESNAADGALVSLYADPTTHRLLVDASVTIAANSSVNVNQFGGTGVTLGQKAMTASMPVVIASDQASFPVTIAAGSAVIGHVITDSGSVVVATLSAETTKVIGTVNIAAAQTIAVTNAGTFVVQENGAALTSLQLIDDVIATLGTTTYTEATTKGAIIGAVRRDADTTLVDTTNEIAPLQVNAAGQLKVALITAIPAGSAVIGKVSIDQTTPGTTNLVALAANQSVNVAQMNGVTVLMGNGASGTGVQRVTIANDSTGQVVLATGSAAIGKLTANSGVIIGDVNVVSSIPGTAATSLGKAEDAAHTSGDTGVFVLGVRNDNLATTYGADQDYGPIATDLKGRVMVAQKAATGTLSNVASSASNVTLLAANSARIGATITNDSSALLYIKFGATASTSSYTVVLAGAASAPFSYYEVPAGYTGIIDGIWGSATGNARVTEIT